MTTKYNANKNASQFAIADDRDDNVSVSSGNSGQINRKLVINSEF